MVLELSNDFLKVQFKEKGGELSSIKDKDGVEYLWQGNPEYWGGQAPVLFPNCGSVPDDAPLFIMGDEGVIEGHLPRHGLVRKKDFEHKIINDHQIMFSIESNSEMLKQYPYPFRLSIFYTLDKSKIEVEYLVENLGLNQDMPYFIGAHPGFNCPLFENERYEDYYLEFENEENCSIPASYPETGLLDIKSRSPFLNKEKILALDYDLFSKDAITLDKLVSRSVTLKSKNHNKAVKIDFQDFPYLILWSTANKGPFIAIEPWGGLSTSKEESVFFNYKENVTFIEPEMSDYKTYSIEITEI